VNDDAEKAPFVMSERLARVAAEGRQSATLESIVNSILALRNLVTAADETISEAVA
jgi:hypothetical protein